MSKDRINVSVEPPVKEAASASSYNVSKLVNNFLKRTLRGEETSVATRRVEIERLRDDAEEHEEKAEELHRKADRLERELEDELREKQRALQEAIDEISVTELQSVETPIIETDQEKVQALADSAGVDPDELKRKAIQANADEPTSPTYR